MSLYDVVASHVQASPLQSYELASGSRWSFPLDLLPGRDHWSTINGLCVRALPGGMERKKQCGLCRRGGNFNSHSKFLAIQNVLYMSLQTGYRLILYCIIQDFRRWRLLLDMIGYGGKSQWRSSRAHRQVQLLEGRAESKFCFSSFSRKNRVQTTTENH